MFTDHLESVNAAPATIRTYRFAVEQLGAFLREQGLPTDPRKVKREHLSAWMLHLQRPPDAGGRGLAAQTALQRFQSTRQFFKFLEEAGDIKESPMLRLKPPRVPEKLVPVIADDDLRKLFKVVSGTDFESRRDKAIISIFVDTGIRVSEMAGLMLKDLDVEQREIEVLGKGRRPRILRIVRETRTDLLRYLQARSLHPHTDSPVLWLGKRERLTDNGIRQLVRRRQEQAGIPRIHPHVFRHTFAHNYLKGGGSEGDLVRITGWKDRQMLDRYGASVASERARDAHDTYSPRRGL
ncbi:MAG: tyrosine-type recombinase/integrase [Dehalococcoidia bacterium]